MLMAPWVMAGVSGAVAQELQMPSGPQALEDVQKPMPSRLATLQDPGTSDQIVLYQHSLKHFPSQSWCEVCVDSRSRDQLKIDAVVDLRLHGRRRPGARLQEDGHAARGCWNSQVGA